MGGYAHGKEYARNRNYTRKDERIWRSRSLYRDGTEL